MTEELLNVTRYELDDGEEVCTPAADGAWVLWKDIVSIVGARVPQPATLRQTLELDGAEPTPIRVAGFLRHYALIIRRNERWDVPETMAGAYESAALALEKYHAEIEAERQARA